jgi:hypothetical protein
MDCLLFHSVQLHSEMLAGNVFGQIKNGKYRNHPRPLLWQTSFPVLVLLEYGLLQSGSNLSHARWVWLLL